MDRNKFGKKNIEINDRRNKQTSSEFTKKINFGAQSHVRMNFNLKITISP